MLLKHLVSLVSSLLQSFHLVHQVFLHQSQILSISCQLLQLSPLILHDRICLVSLYLLELSLDLLLLDPTSQLSIFPCLQLVHQVQHYLLIISFLLVQNFLLFLHSLQLVNHLLFFLS